MHRILLLEFLQEKPVMKRIPASNCANRVPTAVSTAGGL